MGAASGHAVGPATPGRHEETGQKLPPPAATLAGRGGAPRCPGHRSQGGLVGDRASSGTAAVTCGFGCHVLSSSPSAHKSPGAPEETKAPGRPLNPGDGRAAWSPRFTASRAGVTGTAGLAEPQRTFSRRTTSALPPAVPSP